MDRSVRLDVSSPVAFSRQRAQIALAYGLSGLRPGVDSEVFSAPRPQEAKGLARLDVPQPESAAALAHPSGCARALGNSFRS